MPYKKVVIILMIGTVVSFQFCSKKVMTASSLVISPPGLPATAFNYSGANYPKHILAALLTTDNTPSDNVITDEGASLGRVLFYDKQLSKNDSVSCSSCHKQDQGFDDNERKSKGFNGGFTTRNSMALLNVRFYKSGKMFWDERAPTLEKQVLQPIQNTTEMGITLTELKTKLNALQYYPPLFEKAFGSSQIDSSSIARALSQFIRSIVTYQSKYDRVKQGMESFTADESQGEQLFLTAGGIPCAGCHAPPLFLSSEPKAPFAFPDPSDQGINTQRRFKSGSLRNIAIRTSLFHTGTVSNLQVMLGGGPGTAPIPNHTVAPQDVQKLLAFLQTLTDPSILTEAKFSDPFKQ